MACAADERYVVPLAVMLTSVVTHVDPSRRLAIHVLDGGVPPRERDLLSAALGRPNVEVRWHTAAAASLERLPLWGRMPVTTYQRLRAPELLPPELRRVIWLDCDLVTTVDVGALWDVGLDGRHLLAAQDIVVPFMASRGGVSRHADLGIPGDAKYSTWVMVGTGVGLHESARVEYLREITTACLWDQG